MLVPQHQSHFYQELVLFQLGVVDQGQAWIGVLLAFLQVSI
jgi:hypothetical protein